MFGIVQQLWNLYFQAEYLLCRNSPAVFSGCRTSQPTSPKPYQILSVVGWITANWDTRNLGNQQEISETTKIQLQCYQPSIFRNQIYQSIEPKAHVGNLGSQPSKRKACSLLVEPCQGSQGHQSSLTLAYFWGFQKGNHGLDPANIVKVVLSVFEFSCDYI